MPTKKNASASADCDHVVQCIDDRVMKAVEDANGMKTDWEALKNILNQLRIEAANEPANVSEKT